MMTRVPVSLSTHGAIMYAYTVPDFEFIGSVTPSLRYLLPTNTDFTDGYGE